MLRLVIVVLLFASQLAHADDITDLVSRCGRPTRDTKSSRNVRHLYYPGVHLVYSRTSDGGWNFSNADVDGRGTILTTTIAERLPCFDPKPAQPAVAVKADTAGPSSGEYVLIFFLAIVAILAVIIEVGKRRMWRNRPQRLCTNCYIMAQPLRHKNQRWYCGHCGADNPAPLDSPLAQAWLARMTDHEPVIDQYLQ